MNNAGGISCNFMGNEMGTTLREHNLNHREAALTLAIAVFAERIRGLSKEDKDDLFELSKALFSALNAPNPLSMMRLLQLRLLTSGRCLFWRLFAQDRSHFRARRSHILVASKLSVFGWLPGPTRRQASSCSNSRTSCPDAFRPL